MLFLFIGLSKKIIPLMFLDIILGILFIFLVLIFKKELLFFINKRFKK